MTVGRTAPMAMALALTIGILGLVGATARASSHLEPSQGIPGDLACAFGVANDITAASFLCVADVSPWAALVVNPSVAGIDSIIATYDAGSRTLTISATDDDPTAIVTILVNKAFLEQHVDSFASDRELRLTNGVGYEGEGTHPMAAGQAMLVFQITHFSTQTIALSPGKMLLVGLAVGAAVAGVAAVAVIRLKRK